MNFSYPCIHLLFLDLKETCLVTVVILFCTRPHVRMSLRVLRLQFQMCKFFKRKTGPFSSQVSEAHYCWLLTCTAFPVLSWPAYHLLLTIIRVCMENITCAKNVLNWCKIKLSFELTYGFRPVVRFPVLLQRFRP